MTARSGSSRPRWTSKRIVTRVEVGGKLSDRKGVSLPDTTVPFSALTEKDRSDLDAALDTGIDWVALSFIQRPEDIAEAKKITRGRAAVMAKIEKPQAVYRLGEILDLADALMVARGDLGVEMPLEKVPGLQKQMTRSARRAGKPVVVATQMLESMITSPVPTRAEVSDVSTAIFEGADAIMLSAESAAGQYPVEAVATMNRIAEEVESDPLYRTIIHAQRTEPEATGADAIAAAAGQIAETLAARRDHLLDELGFDRIAGRARAAAITDRRDLAAALHRTAALAGLGRALHRGRGRPRSRRHGGARLPPRLQGRIRQAGPARHRRRRRAARHAGRDQHAACCVRGGGGRERVGRATVRAGTPAHVERRRLLRRCAQMSRPSILSLSFLTRSGMRSRRGWTASARRNTSSACLSSPSSCKMMPRPESAPKWRGSRASTS